MARDRWVTLPAASRIWRRIIEDCAEPSDGPGERVFGRRAVAYDQGRSVVPGRGAVGAETFYGQAMVGRTGDDLVFVLTAGQFQQHVQTGSDARDPNMRSLSCQRSDQPVSSSAVGEARAAHMPVVSTGNDELSKAELVEGTALPVCQGLGRDHVIDQMTREYQPTDAKPGREALTDRTGVDDVFGR